jgi:hypothetical protein
MRIRLVNTATLGMLFNAPEGEGGGGAGGDAAAQAAAAQAATDAATAAATEAAQAAATAAAQDVKSLPEWAQKVITDARKDAGDNRVAKTAAETDRDASKAIVDAINAALNPGAAADPTKLAEQLTTAAAKQRDAEVRLAVFTAATAAGANPVALLDRNSFTNVVKGLDPSADDFSTKVTAAITAAVTADPNLKAARAAGTSTVDHGAGGSGDTTTRTPKTLDQAVAAHYGG